MSTSRADILTPLQQRFADEYLKDLNATAAYKRAGYKAQTDESAAAGASTLLRVPKVAAAIRAGQQSRVTRVHVDQDYVIGRLQENVERSMQVVAVRDDDGKPIGEYRYEGSVANKALELLGKHLGLFPNKHEVSGPQGTAIAIDWNAMRTPRPVVDVIEQTIADVGKDATQ